jgi:hypothetical protein|tara:strand:- start:12560 stop:13279 length:720 start_codon:yes stop_codon:yes gene_type:complete
MVSVDTVYQRVLALANKEQRGYITPQEFNLLANQAQMGIFEEYFHHLNQYLRTPGNNSEYSDSVDYIEDKLGRFHIVGRLANPAANNNIPIPGDFYRLTGVSIQNPRGAQVCEQTTSRKWKLRQKATFSARSLNEHPTYVRVSNGPSEAIIIYSGNGIWPGAARLDGIRKPRKVEWDYVVVNEKALYNANGSSNFDLHPSEETTLVYKILELSGIVINKPGIQSLAKAEVAEQNVTEKS